MSISQISFSQVSYGFQGGVSFFEITKFNVPKEFQNDSDFKSSFVDSYYTELFTDVTVKNNFSTQIGISLLSKGEAIRIYKNEEAYGYPSDYRVETRLRYIELPMMAKYTVPLSRRVRLEFGGGMSVGYLFKAKNTTRMDWISTSIEIPLNSNSPINRNRWDVAIISDIAIRRKTIIGDLKVGFRSSFDLTHQFNYDNSINLVYREKNYNWGLAFYAGYVINQGQFKSLE